MATEDPDKKHRRHALRAAFKAVHHRAANAEEARKIDDAVRNHGKPGRPRKDRGNGSD